MSAGAVAQVGTREATGLRNRQTAKQIATTRLVRPVLPPAPTPSSGLNERGAGGSTANSARNRCNGVAGHALVNVDRIAVLVQHVCLRSGAVQGADGVEHIDEAERNDEHDCGEDAAELRACERTLPSVSLEHTGDADGAEILKGLADLAHVEGRGRTGKEIVQNGNACDADEHAALDVVLFKNCNDEQTEECEDGRHKCLYTFNIRKECACLQCAVDINELNERVLVSLDDADILEAEESDEQTDTGRDCFLEAVRKSLCNLDTETRDREQQEDNTGNQNDDEACMVALDDVAAGDDFRQNEGYEEEGVQTHAASLCKRHLRIQSHQQRTDDCCQNGCDIHSVPNLLEGRVGIRSQMVEANNLVRVRDYDVSHREERRETGNDLCADVRATLGNFEEFVQGCSLSYKLKNFLFFVFLTSYGLHTSEKQELLPIV